jgi:hypothetical protein
MPYVGKSPSAVGVRSRYYFTASGGETSLSGSDNNGKTLVFTDAAYVDVILNGNNLVSGTDYVAVPNTNTISGLAALVANDVVEIISYDVFSVADTVPASTGGTFSGSLTVSGNIAVTGTVDSRDVAADGTKLDGIEAAADVTDATNVAAAGALMTTGGSVTGNVTFGDNDKAIFGAGSDLQIYHDGSHSYIQEAGQGRLYVRASDGIKFDNTDSSKTGLSVFPDSAVYAYYNNALKFETTATGVDVTGTVTADGLTVDGTSRFNNYIHFGGSISTPSTAAAIYRPADNQLAFSTANTERMRIDSSGNVGIGLANPTYLLQLASTDPRIAIRNDNAGTWFTSVGWAIPNSNDYSIVQAGVAERLRINSSGHVTMPSQPSFAASRNQGDVSSGIYVFANLYHNTGNHYSNTTGRFTAPITGLYFFSTNMMSSNAGTYNNSYYEITKNGSGYQRVYSSNGISVHHRWNWSGVIYLAAGDYIAVDNPGGSSLVLYGGSNEYTTFTGFLVG